MQRNLFSQFAITLGENSETTFSTGMVALMDRHEPLRNAFVRWVLESTGTQLSWAKSTVDAEKGYLAPSDRGRGRAYVDLVVKLDDDVELWCELKTTGSLGKYRNGVDQIDRYVCAGLRMGMSATRARALARSPTPIPRKQGTPRVLIALISMISIDLDDHRSWRTSKPADDHGGFLWADPRGHLVWSDFSAPARAALDGLEGFEGYLRDQFFVVASASGHGADARTGRCLQGRGVIVVVIAPSFERFVALSLQRRLRPPWHVELQERKEVYRELQGDVSLQGGVMLLRYDVVR